jgi:very-short-patch-repair endonuclease
MSFVIASGFRAVVSHRAAARLHGLPGFEHAEDEFTMPTGVDVGRNRSLELHHTNRLPAAQVVRVDSLPVTCVARTLLDLTAVVSLGRSARAMDTALAQKRVTYWELVSLLAAVTARGRRRTQVFRLLLEERGPHYRPPESELERRFDRLVVRSGLSGWIRQVDLGDTESWIGRVDFYHRRDRIVVELDGKVAHSSFMDTKSDRERDRRLTAAGFLVLRFGWAQVVHDGPTVIAAINATKATP